MRALLDVNVLIALLDTDHIFHASATSWFAAHARLGWASCPITENGCIRIMSHPGYPNPLPVRAVMERLAAAARSKWHEFWPDDISLLDPRTVDSSRIHGHRQITDIYLLSLAVRHSGRFVTFDTAISPQATTGGHDKHLVRLRSIAQ